MRFLKAFIHIVIIALLTLITQVGGVIWIVAFGFFKLKKSDWNKRKRLLSFTIIYTICVFTIVPFVASLNNRKALPVFNQHIKPHNLGYALLCRNYVRTDLWHSLELIATNHYQQTNKKLVYLDAGFPFLDGFPLLPHLSHNDGRKVDIAFEYKTIDGTTNFFNNPSLLGYGVYEEPLPTEFNQTEKCKDAGYWQYDYAKYLGIRMNGDLILDKKRTKSLITEVLNVSKVQKLFIEPHLIPRLEFNQLPSNKRNKIRFHGCHAVRHDDHIHFQVHP